MPPEMSRFQKRPRAPFVLTLGLAAMAAACGSESSDISNPPAVPCPNSLPSNGDPCPAGHFRASSCPFPSPCNPSGSVLLVCNGGEWSVSADTCSCPSTEPQVGDQCGASEIVVCTYGVTSLSCIDKAWEAVQVTDGGSDDAGE